MSKHPTWPEFSSNLLRYSDPDLWLDYSRMGIPKDYPEANAAAIKRAIEEMRNIESGEIVNTDENRMVGHYWLRNPSLAPKALEPVIIRNVAEIKAFASGIHKGEILTPRDETFLNLLVIGIGGSALGPQLAIDALTGADIPMSVHFLDNTDPDGIDREIKRIGNGLNRPLVWSFPSPEAPRKPAMACSRQRQPMRQLVLTSVDMRLPSRRPEANLINLPMNIIG